MKKNHKKLGVTLSTITVLTLAQWNTQAVQGEEIDANQTNIIETSDSTQAVAATSEATSTVASEETSSVISSQTSSTTIETISSVTPSNTDSQQVSASGETTTSTTEQLASNEQTTESSEPITSSAVASATTSPQAEEMTESIESQADSSISTSANSSSSTNSLELSMDAQKQATSVTTNSSIYMMLRTTAATPTVNYTIEEDSVFGKYVLASEFGVDATGQTDSLSAIKDALAYADSQSLAVKLPTGTIYLSDVLKIDDTYASVTGLFGERDTMTIITFDKTQDGVHDPETNTTDNREYAGILVENKDGFNLGRLSVHYTGGDFYREGQSYFGRVNGIYVNDSSNTLITDVRVSGVNRAGIFFGSTKSYEVDPRSSTGKTYYKRVLDGEIGEDDPQLPLGVNNSVENSRLTDNRVAGILFAFQKDFSASTNILAYNGHEADGGTGYGVASMAGSYNYGITFKQNTTDHNYRKGLDIHDGNRITIVDNTSFGDRLYGIAVYNRDYVMDEVTITGNIVYVDPDFRLFRDDGTLYQDPATGKIVSWGNYTYHGYTGIEVQTNTQSRDWKQDTSDKGNFVISNNTITGIETYQNNIQTYGIIFRNFENTMDYQVYITDNTISGESTKYGIAVINNTQLNSGKKGLGSGDILVQNNDITFKTFSQNGVPIYIEEKNAPTTTRGTVTVTDNDLLVTDGSQGFLGIQVLTSNAKTITVADNNLDQYGELAYLGRYFVRVTAPEGVENKPEFYALNNVMTTKNNYSVDTNSIYRWVKLQNGWVGYNTSQVNPVISGNIVDGSNTPNVGVTVRKTETTTQTSTGLTTEYREDENFPLGYREVIVQGTPEERVVVYEISTVNGMEVSRREVSSQVITPGVNRVILLGTGKETQTLETITETTDYKTVIQTDPTKPRDYKEVIQSGIAGSTDLTYEVTIVNGEEYKRELVTSTETQAVQDEIIVIGTGVESVDYYTEDEVVAFETEIVYDPAYTKDYEVVQQVGQDGIVQKQYKRTYFNGELTSTELVNTTTTQPVTNKIIVKGLGVVVRYEKYLTVREVTYSQVIVEDESKPEGYREVTQQGTNGVVTTTYEIKYEDDVEVSRTEISKVIDPQTVDEIISIGIGELTENLKVSETPIPFQTVYIENPNITKGDFQVLTPGVTGIQRKEVLVTYLNGEEYSRETISDSIITEVVNEVVEVGTRDAVVTKESYTEEVVIPYRTTYIESADYLVGTSLVQVVGQDGLRIDTYERTYLDGELQITNLTNSQVTKETVDQVVIIGTAVTTHAEETVKTPIPYTSSTVEEKTLPVGYRDVLQAGSNGLQTSVYKITYVNGVVAARELLSSETTQPVTNEIIIIGTGVTRSVYEAVNHDVAFGTVALEDDSLTIGQTVLDQVGQVGQVQEVYLLTYFNDDLQDRHLVETLQLAAPVTQIVRVGTKPATKRTIEKEAEVVAFATETQSSFDYPVGYRQVLQVGQNGSRLNYYEVVSDVNGEISRSFLYSEEFVTPVSEIILLGTGIESTQTDVVDQVIPYQVLTIEDDTMEEGHSLVEQAGRDGLLRSTYVLEYLNNKRINRYLVETEVIEAVSQIVRVGAKTPDVVTVEEASEILLLPYRTQYQSDSSQPAGYRQVLQAGQNGSQVNIYRVTYVNGEIVSRELTETIEVSSPVNEIIKLGKAHQDTLIKEPFKKREILSSNLISSEQATPASQVSSTKKASLPATGDDSKSIYTASGLSLLAGLAWFRPKRKAKKS